MSRGQVTGANRFWIEGPHAAALPDRFLIPVVTRARDLLRAGPTLDDLSPRRRVIDFREDLDELAPADRGAVETFLRRARAAGIDKGYIAAHRRPWWSVGLHPPAPILATYMARRPPAFVLNLAGARHIKIAHGLYPRVPQSPAQLDVLARYLTAHTPIDRMDEGTAEALFGRR